MANSMRNFQELSRTQQYRRKRAAGALGVGLDEVEDTRGRHGHQARGKGNGRWNAGRIISSHGYVKIRVGREHPLADPNGYAYEHLLVWVSAGFQPPAESELLHHKDEDRQNNRIGNLEKISRSGHGELHITQRARDQKGRLLPKSAGRLLDGREWREVPESQGVRVK